MGGIIGKLSFDPEEPPSHAVVEDMLEALRHGRGGARGMYAAPGIALGSNDCHVGTSDRVDIRAVADSSISNAAQVRAQLEQLGHRWRDATDSELVAHAYAEWGPRCVARLRGPFACAIWDGAARRLLLARDHIGIRPLYFALLPDEGVVFGSEIRALLRDPRTGREWCPRAIDAYLALGYVPAPLTPYQRISKLEPAQIVVIEGRRLRAEQYWDLPPAARPSTANDTADALDQHLRRAVRRHLRDQHVNGVLYSGGLASSSLLAALPPSAASPVTVAVDEDPTELTRSEHAASHLGRTRQLETTTAPLPLLASELTGHVEEPIADPAATAQFAICMAARRHTDCALTGHGAAALWAGTARHRHALWDGFHRREIYTRSFAWQVRDANPFARHLELYASRDGARPLDRAWYVDARTFLPDSTLASIDRAALAAGLRLRFPFLDRDVVELASATPAALKQRGSLHGYTLRRLLLRKLPRPLMPAAKESSRRDLWLQTALASMVPAFLLVPRFDGRGIVSRPALAQLWNEHRSGHGNHARRLWSLLILELWFRQFIDDDAADLPLEYAVVKVA